MIIALAAALICIPLLIGTGIAALMRKKNHNGINLWETYICGIICCIGIFEAGHLTGIFMDLTITFCGKIILLMLAAASLLSCLLILLRYKIERNIRRNSLSVCSISGVIFIMLLIIQVIYICMSPVYQPPGDIIMETVNSFWVSDGIYTVSPLTGKVYSGAPFRYEILCLPTVYTLLAKWFLTEPVIIVGKVIPVLVLCLSYIVYYLLSGTLFGIEQEQKEKRWWFLVILGIIFLLSENAAYMEGYGLLHGGYLGTTLRNSVLIPLTIYASLERKWWMAILCILGEVCIVWTFWGLGLCAAITVIIAVVGIVTNSSLKNRLFSKMHNKGGNNL